MQELLSLLEECLNRYRYDSCQACDSGSCKLGLYCAEHNCIEGNCESCMNHIQRAVSPDFHYSCERITYHYVLRFFNRFASEIAYIMDSTVPGYLQGKTRLNVVSLGCGPGSEVYGFIKSLREKSPEIVLHYKGYDLNNVWDSVQKMSTSTLSQTPHVIEFYNVDMFKSFTRFDGGEVDFLVLNYILSDYQKYHNNNDDKSKFINEIVHFIIENKVSNIIFNDMCYYGEGGLDSGVGMMLCLIKELAKIKSISSTFRYFPSDGYVPNLTWKKNKQEALLFESLQDNTLDVNIDKCKSKQILVHINQ